MASQWPQRSWAIEDCRHVSRALEADLLRAGEQVLRVPARLMAGARRSRRARGKSDPIDALAVAPHRIAVTQLRGPTPGKAYVERRMANANTKCEAIRALVAAYLTRSTDDL